MPNILKKNKKQNTSLLKHIKEVVKYAPAAVFTTIDENGFPEARAMLNLPQNNRDPLRQIWLTTNTDSLKVQQVKNSAKTSVYFYLADEQHGLKGVLLTGRARIIKDRKIKAKIWDKRWKIYYPSGVNDPDYSVICFTPQALHFYYQLSKIYMPLNRRNLAALLSKP
jgi:general stress protein 26